VHEVGHFIRYLYDGGEDHYLDDAARFNYRTGVNPCAVTNQGFGFDYGWADYYARMYQRDQNGVPASRCNGPHGDDRVEANVAAAIASLEERCLNVSQEHMIRALRRNPGTIHSLGRFRSAVLSESNGCGLKGLERSPLHGTGALPLFSPVSRARFVRSELDSLTSLDRTLKAGLDNARRAAKEPLGCPPVPCLSALRRTTTPAFLQGEIAESKVLRRVLGFQTSPRALKRLRSPLGSRYQRAIARKKRRLVRGVTTALGRGVRQALRAARPVLRRDHSRTTRALVRRIRSAMRALRHAGRRGRRFPAGFRLVPFGADQIRFPGPPGTPGKIPPPPPPPGLMPDLVVTVVGKDNFTVSNPGLASAGPFSVSVVDAARGFSQTFAYGGLPAAGSFNQTFQCQPSGSIVVTVDIGNTVAESDETNNVGQGSGNTCVY
jgi:hypothetical protein